MATPPPVPAPHDRIAAGVAAGIITADQALALRQLPLDSIPQRFSTVQSGDEPFALFRGFRDVFLALGIIVLAIGLGGVAVEALGLQFDGVVGVDDVVLAAALAAIAWGVGEWVTARLRMPLASLVIALSFSAAFMATLLLGLSVLGLIDLDDTSTGTLATIAFAIGSLVFYLRFRLPFTMLMMACSIVGLVYAFLGAQLQDEGASLQMFNGAIGLAAFLVALFYELKDPQRTQRFSENAFWLHLVSAPLIVFALTGGLDALDINSTADAVRVFVIVAVLGLIALMIDRRAFIVSAMLYLGGAIGYAISQSGVPSNVQFAAAALILGLFVVSLALGWQPLRRGFLRALPDGLSQRLPNPVGPDALGG